MDAEALYRKKTPRSARLFARSERLHPGGVSHNIRFFEPYPFVSASASGSRISDADGNRYTDYWMGHWSLVLGHSPPRVRAALAAQLGKGWMHGTANGPTLRLSELIRRAVPAAEKIRYTASGTEAVAYSVRLARAATGKKTVAKIEGGWHGYGPGLVRSVNAPFDAPEGAGMSGEENTVSLPYNDLEGSLKVLRGVESLACVVAEPLLGGGGGIPAEPDYLKGLQEFAQKRGALFVLDEIVTGFRLRYGCAYQPMGLSPDIVTLGKIIGGGMPVGAMCGTGEVMKLADARSCPRKKRAYVGGGTFSANPASMVCGYETLSELKGRHAALNRLGGAARKKLASAFSGEAAVTGAGSLFAVHFGEGPVKSAADAAACDQNLQKRYHFEMIAKDGIFCLPGKMGSFSAAHSDADAKRLASASERFAQSFRK